MHFLICKGIINIFYKLCDIGSFSHRLQPAQVILLHNKAAFNCLRSFGCNLKARALRHQIHNLAVNSNNLCGIGKRLLYLRALHNLQRQLLFGKRMSVLAHTVNNIVSIA